MLHFVGQTNDEGSNCELYVKLTSVQQAQIVKYESKDDMSEDTSHRIIEVYCMFIIRINF